MERPFPGPRLLSSWTIEVNQMVREWGIYVMYYFVPVAGLIKELNHLVKI